MSARRRRLQRSGRSLGGKHWSVAGSGRSRGSQRCGGGRASRVAPGLAPAPVMQRAGLGIPGSERELGVGGVAAPPRLASRCPRRLHPELAPAGWVTPPAGQASLGAPVCVLGCSGTQGLVGESSCFLGASRPRGIPAGHTWPELRPGTGLTQPSGLWVASGSPTCLRACRVESENSSCCLLVPGLMRYCLKRIRQIE